MSIAHWCAATLLTGRAGVAEARAVDDPAVRALRSRVVAIPDETLARDQARVSVLMRSGQRLEADVRHATGSSANPLTDAALRSKALEQASTLLGLARAERVVSLLLEADGLPDLAELLAAATSS